MSDYNDWGVQYSTICFFERALNSNEKVESFQRENDVLFRIKRKDGLSDINMLLVDIYTVGLSDVMRAISEFPDVDCVVTCANWNGYTADAKKYGLDNNVGVFVAGEFFGALWWKYPYKYAKKDRDGRESYHYKSA